MEVSTDHALPSATELRPSAWGQMHALCWKQSVAHRREPGRLVCLCVTLPLCVLLTAVLCGTFKHSAPPPIEFGGASLGTGVVGRFQCGSENCVTLAYAPATVREQN